MLIAQGFGPLMELAPGYLTVLRQATAKNQDGPGASAGEPRKTGAMI
jgi:hypothetical protein